MPDRDDEHLLRRIARLYWLEDKDQSEIGALLGMSKSTVSRKLTAARAAGIVQVTVVGAEKVERATSLEHELLRRLPLRDAFVADPDPGVEPLRDVGRLAADVFADRAPRARRIGVSWGSTIAALADSVPQLALHPDTVLTPIVGGMPSVDTGASGNHVIISLAQSCGVRAHRVDAPAVVESPATQAALLRESSVAASLDFARGCDLAFVGIGAFGTGTSQQVLRAMRFTPDELDQIQAAHPVGDVLGRFFDESGTPLGPPSSHRVIALDIEDLSAIPAVIGIAAGTEKTRGVLGAMRSGAFDGLVVDRELAVSLIAAAGSLSSSGGLGTTRTTS